MASLIAKAILTLLGGIGVFLLAVRLLSRNIEAISGNGLKSLFSKTSKNKFLGVGLGTFTAAVIQSSGAVTVMVIGFINAGLMDLVQGAAISFGANIGTTITGQIVALGMFGQSAITSTVIFSALTGVGAFIVLFAKNDMLQKIGSIIAGFGLLFVGLEIMSSSMKSFAEMESVKSAIATISNPILLVLIGAAITAMLQSSSVMSSIMITMVFSGLITLDQGIFIVMGSNIGAGIVAIIASFGGSADAKRVATIHMFFNVFGAVVFLIVQAIVSASSSGAYSIGTPFALAFPDNPQTQLAMFHTAYNILKVAVFLPFTNFFCKLFTKIIKEKSSEKKDIGPQLSYIEEHFLKTPPIAVNMVKREIERMCQIAMENFNRSIEIVCTLDFHEQKKFESTEVTLNYLNKKIINFVVDIPRDQISDNDNLFLSTTYHSVSDLERIGDYAENIVEYATAMKTGNYEFSKQAIDEVRYTQKLINDLYGKVYLLFTEGDTSLMREISTIEDEVDDVTQKMSDSHIKRMDEGVCSSEAGALYLELSSNMERIADHLVNVAKSTRKYANAQQRKRA